MKKKNTLGHSDIVEAAYYWAMNSGKCAFVLKEMHSTTYEIPDIIGFFGYCTSMLIECKASRGDFLADKKKSFRQNPSMGMGKYRFYCCPDGMIKKEELPPKWGLIYVGNTGNPRCVLNPLKSNSSDESIFEEYNEEGEKRMMYTALRFTELGVDVEKAIYIGRVINQIKWGNVRKMPKYINEISKRTNRDKKELIQWLKYLISLWD